MDLKKKEMEFEVMDAIKKMPDNEIRHLFYEMELDVEYPRVRSSKTMRDLILQEEDHQLGNMDAETVKDEWKCFCGNREEVGP